MTSGEKLLELVAVMDRLRSPGGCPWDAKQTHHSLLEYLIEEAYETVEAVELEDAAALQEELGDLLLQVIFHARIAQDEDGFDIDDVAEGIVTKLVARHPHVFGDVEVVNDEELESNWNRIKAEEKRRESVTEGIPTNLPALLLASKLQARSKDLPLERDDLDALSAEVADEAALGRLLWNLVRLARVQGWDAESALRGEIRRQRDAIRQVEGRPLPD